MSYWPWQDWLKRKASYEDKRTNGTQYRTKSAKLSVHTKAAAPIGPRELVVSADA